MSTIDDDESPTPRPTAEDAAAARDAARDAALDAAEHAARDAARDAALDAAQHAARDDAREALDAAIEAISQEIDSESAPGAAGDSADPDPDLDADGDSADPDIDPVQVLADRMAELQGELLRAHAETENVRKRGERMVADAHKFAASGFAKDMVGVADNLQRALHAVAANRRQDNDLIDTVLTGVEAVERELVAAFQRHGIERIDPLDTPFDPNFHQAMFEVPDSGKPSGTIVQVLQPGYVINGRLLRPAMVGVAKGDGPEPPRRVDTTV